MIAASLLALALSPAHAAELADAPVLSADEQVLHDQLVGVFDTHFFPERVDAPVHLPGDHPHRSAAILAETGDGFACLTQLVAELKQNWHLFSPAERAEMTAMLTPWKADLVDPSWVEGDPPPPPGSPCFARQYDDYVDGEYHSVQWESGAISRSMAEAFLDELEFSYEMEVEEQGWKAPNRIETYAMMVLVPEGNQAGAYTTVERCGNAYLPYVVAFSGGFRAGDWWKTMACHEFNHASQFSYGMAHEFWWWEATASYSEEYVYPEHNDWADFVSTYGRMPHIGLNASAGNSNDQWLFYHTYAMAIWGFYLDENYGGLDAVQETWELADERGSTYGYDYWMPDVVEDMGLDFDEVWTGFMATNAVMDYRERDDMPRPELTDKIDELPADGDEDNALEPQSLGMAFIEFDDDVAEDGKALKVAINAEDGPEWYAVLVRGDTSVEDMVVIDLNEDGEGIGTIDFAEGDDITLVLSPVDEDAQGYGYNWTRADSWGFAWTAEVVESETADPPGLDGEGDDESGTLACGCASAGPASVPLSLGLLGLVVVARRRRN